MGKYTAARDLDLSVKTRWYVVANRTEAVIYQDGSDHQFRFVQRLSNVEGKETESQLASDKPGKGSSSAGNGTIHHALGRNNKHETAAKKFAGQIVHALEVGKKESRYTDLVLVAEPHFLGLLRQSLPRAVQSVVSHEVGREYRQGSDAELRSQIMAAITNAK